MASTRKAAVSGMFYPNDKIELEKLLTKIYDSEKDNIKIKLSENKIIGGIVPHAGYIYSGYETIHFFEILRKSEQIFDTAVIINPNHTGHGKPISLDTNNYWETPFGKLETDSELAEKTGFDYSEIAHKNEHSSEVILPFLQYFLKFNFKILPVTMSVQNYETAKYIAQKIFEAEKILNRKIIFIASSDFSHYVKPEEGFEQDMKIIELILRKKPKKMIEKVHSKQISMCGYGPAASLLEYCKLLKTENCKLRLLKFGNSGKKKYSDSVVDYASILAYKKNK